MKRFVLRLEFEGTPFCGWQSQDKELEAVQKPAIQSILEEHLKTLLRSPDRVLVQGCGRTDAGVHAEDFYCHFDVDSPDFDPEKIRHGLNALLPPQISALDCFEAPAGFHAIESVQEKIYRYQILIRRTKPSFLRERTWWFPSTLESFSVGLLEEAAQSFLGEHDFFAFSASGSSVKSTVRRLNALNVKLLPLGNHPCFGHQLNLEFRARGFLRHMVRFMSGTLCEIALGKHNVEFVRETLKASPSHNYEKLPRLLCAPAHGLFLAKVNYEKT